MSLKFKRTCRLPIRPSKHRMRASPPAASGWETSEESNSSWSPLTVERQHGKSSVQRSCSRPYSSVSIISVSTGQCSRREKILTEQVDSRLLRVIWCLPKLLREAPGIQEQSIYTGRRDNGVRHTLPWWPRNGLLYQTISALSLAYHLDRLATVYPRTGRRLFCK